MTTELTPREQKLLRKRGYETLPLCQLDGCNIPVKIGKANGFYLCVGCCPEHIRKINALRSGKAQLGKKNPNRLTSLTPEQKHKLKEKGYILIDETFSEGYNVSLNFPINTYK